MSISLEKLTEGFIQVLTEDGPLLIHPPFFARMRLIWMFRNFSILPQQVLSPAENLLIDELCSNGRPLRRSARLAERDALIGTVISAAVPTAPLAHERRKEARCPASFEIEYGLKTTKYKGEGSDVSSGGIGFSGPKVYAPGTELVIRYRMQSTDKWTRAHVLVRHCSEGRMGAQFLRFD